MAGVDGSLFKKKKGNVKGFREFLELCLIFLGGNCENFHFCYAGAMHHARWLSKVIYSLKIYRMQPKESDVSG